VRKFRPSVKVRENRLRRIADRRGLRLTKSRQRDPRGLTFGHYRLEDSRSRLGVAVEDPLQRGYPFSDLDDVEVFLNG